MAQTYNRSDSEAFAQKVSKKIAGWYSKREHHDKAVERIVKQREEIISLLESVKKVDVTQLLKYLDDSGFYYRPSSGTRHHNFPGGLAEHSLGTFKIVEHWNNLSPKERHMKTFYPFAKFLVNKKVSCDIINEKMDHDDMVIAAICHDLCKAKQFYLKGRSIKIHNSDYEAKCKHSALSVERLKALGINTAECDELLLAVREHMSLFSKARYNEEAKRHARGQNSMLAIAVWAADKIDASRHPARKSNYCRNRSQNL